MLTSPLYAQKSSEKPEALVMQEREICAQYTEADRTESLRSNSSEGQKASVNPDDLIRSYVFRTANPANFRGSLLESN